MALIYYLCVKFSCSDFQWTKNTELVRSPLWSDIPGHSRTFRVSHYIGTVFFYHALLLIPLFRLSIFYVTHDDSSIH